MIIYQSPWCIVFNTNCFLVKTIEPSSKSYSICVRKKEKSCICINLQAIDFHLKKETIRTFITRPVIYLSWSICFARSTTYDNQRSAGTEIIFPKRRDCLIMYQSWTFVTKLRFDKKKHLAKSTCSPSLSGNFWCVWFQNNKVAHSYGYSVWNQLYLLVHLSLLTDFDFGCIGCSMIVIV